MSISRSLFSSSKRFSTEPLNLIQRFCPSKRVQCRNYAKSSGRGRRENPVMNIYEEPSTSSPWKIYVASSAVLGLAGFAAFIRYNDERRSVPKGLNYAALFKLKCEEPVNFRCKPSQGNSSPGVILKGPSIGGPFSLIDSEHRPVTDKDFLGNWVLLYFGYTSSPDLGPEQLQLIAKAVDILDSKQNIVPVFVTLDPQRDSPSQLRAYLKDFHPRIVGLTGPVCTIKQIARQYRVFFKKIEEDGIDYLVESSHNMYLLNPNMEVVRCFGPEYNAEQLSESILEEVKRTSI